MKRLTFPDVAYKAGRDRSKGDDEVVDVVPRGRWRRRLILVVSLAAMMIAAFFAWRTFAHQPARLAAFEKAALAKMAAPSFEGRSPAELQQMDKGRQYVYLGAVAANVAPKDPDAADALLERASSLGAEAESLAVRADLLEEGVLGADRRGKAAAVRKQAFKVAEQRADKDPWAKYQLAKLLSSGRTESKDRARAVALALQAAEAGSGELQLEVGRSLYLGMGVFEGAPNETEGLRLIEIAARSHKPAVDEAVDLLVWRGTREFEPGNGKLSAEASRAFALAQAGAREGNAYLMAQAGYLEFLQGRIAEARGWLTQASSLGSREYSNILALLQFGAAVKPDAAAIKRVLTDHLADHRTDLTLWSNFSLHAVHAAEFSNGYPKARFAAVASAGAALRDSFMKGNADALMESLPRQLRQEAMALSRSIVSASAHSTPAARAPELAALATQQEERQATGYLKGAPRRREVGLSTLTVDNSGQVDATVRLYEHDKGPAAYSFYVRAGEQFTATKIVAGSYILRYRHQHDPQVLQAEKPFVFTEVSLPSGKQYTKARVTLYSVPGGNLPVVPVSPELF